MTQTIRAVQSAEMAGRARFERWREAWEAAFFRPAMIDMMRATLANIPPEQAAKLREQNPEAFERVMGKGGL